MIEEKYDDFYCKTIVCESFFTATDRVNCLLPYNSGRDLVIGTDNGIYLVNQRPNNDNVEPWRILATVGVTQIDILEEHRLFLVLSNGTLFLYPIEVLLNAIEHEELVFCEPWKVQDNVDFFKIGISLGRRVVCSVNTSASSSNIKLFEPTVVLCMRLAQDSLHWRDGKIMKLLKEFHFPAECWSVHFLQSTLVIGCTKGFEIIDLDTADIYPLLDQMDTSLDFVSQQECLQPFHIERMDGIFLLGYDKFSFFVNRNGWRAHPDWKITWKGTPKSITVSYPYILAFGLDLVEIWHIETGKLLNVISGHNFRLLHSHLGQTIYAFEDEGSEDVIASLTF